jgi:hypothetical protein
MSVAMNRSVTRRRITVGALWRVGAVEDGAKRRPQTASAGEAGALILERLIRQRRPNATPRLSVVFYSLMLMLPVGETAGLHPQVSPTRRVTRDGAVRQLDDARNFKEESLL